MPRNPGYKEDWFQPDFTDSMDAEDRKHNRSGT